MKHQRLFWLVAVVVNDPELAFMAFIYPQAAQQRDGLGVGPGRLRTGDC